MKIFLGGTCNESTWREQLIPMLNIDYFNPVVDDWNDEAKKNEIYQKEVCDYLLYTITPKLKGFYSIAEVTYDSIKNPNKTIFCFLKEDDGIYFDEQELNSLNAIANMIKNNGGKVLYSLKEIANYVNKKGL